MRKLKDVAPPQHPRRALRLAARASAALLLAGFACFAGPVSGQIREAPSGRNPRGATLSVNVFADLGDEVTQKMLASQSFQRILSEKPQPRLVVGNVSNRTGDENVPVGDIARRVSELLIESGLVRWFEFGTDKFDFVVSPLLTETLLSDGRRREYRLTLTLTISDVHGEVRGRWSADRTYVR